MVGVCILAFNIESTGIEEMDHGLCVYREGKWDHIKTLVNRKSAIKGESKGLPGKTSG